MGASVAERLPATPREKLAEASADLKHHTAKAQLPASPLREIAADALRKVTSQKAAALDVDLSEGRLSHKLQDGSLTLAQLEKLGPAYGAELGRLLTEHFAPLNTPAARLRQRAADLEDVADELKQLAEFIA